MRSLRVVSIAAIAFAVGSCSPEFRAPFDISHTDLHLQQTFGQLVTHNATTSPATFIKVKLPAGADVRTPTSGVIKYEPNFEGLGPSLLLNPTTYFSSDSDFKFIEDEGLPDESDIRIVLANLDEGSVRDAAQSRYATVLNKANPTAEAANFIAKRDGNREIDVVASATLANSTPLGKAQGDVLYVAAYTQDDGRVKTWVNPLPYILAGLVPANHSGVDSEVPEITEVVLAASTNANMSSPSLYTVPSSNNVEQPNVLYNHVSVYARIQERSKPTTANLAPYEFSYFFYKITRDGGGSILTRTLVSQGRHLMNKISAGSAIAVDSIYEPNRTDAIVQDFWYQLPIDNTPIANGLSKKNWSSDGTARVLDLSSFAAGEYELLLRVRDAVMPGGLIPTYTERRIFVNVDSSPSAIQGARWSLNAQSGPNTSSVEAAGEPGSLTLSGGAPWTADLQLVGAPAVTAPAKVRYKIRGNGVDIDSTSDANLFPSGNDQFATAQSITLNNEGVHDVTVWIDSDDDQVLDDEEASRRLVILSFDPVLTLTAESKHPATAYSALTSGTSIGSTDSLRLTLNVTGVPNPTVMGAAEYAWEIATTSGPITTSGSNIWEATDIPFTGEMVAEVTLDLFGAKFEQAWSQTVIGAQFAEIRSLCASKIKSVAVELSPSNLPIGDSVELSIAATGSGAAQFSGGAVIQMLPANSSVDVEATAVSTARNDLALVAKYAGVEIAKEEFSVCGGLRFVSSGGAPASSLVIGRWFNAYDSSQTIRNDDDTVDNFIDDDDAHFFVEVVDWDKNVDPARPEVVTGNIEVIGGGTSDSKDTVRLVETGPNTGVFRSYSHLLVGPDLPSGYHSDDDFEAYDGFDDETADDTFGDRTHRSAVDSTVLTSYSPDPQTTTGPSTAAVAATASICQVGGNVCTYDAGAMGTRCTANLTFRILNEPFSDIGVGIGNGQLDSHDCDGDGSIGAKEAEADPNNDGAVASSDDTGICAGNGHYDVVAGMREPFKDLSEGINEWGTNGNYGGVESEVRLTTSFNVANATLAQFCIDLTRTPGFTYSNPPGTVLNNGDISLATSSAGYPTSDMGVIDAAFPAVAPLTDVAVIAVGKIDGAGAVALSAGFNASSSSARGTSAAIYMGTPGHPERNILAHELAHVFSSCGDYNGSEPLTPEQFRRYFFPYNDTFNMQTAKLNLYRRLEPGTVPAIRRQLAPRTAATTCAYAPGRNPVGNINLQ